MAALARAVLTTTLLTCTAVRPLAVFSNTHMLIIMFSCVFYACAYDGFALFALPSWLAPAVDPKIVDIQFQAFASVCCAIAGTLFLVTAIYFSVFPAEARRVIAERGESWWWPERRSGAEGEDAPTIWNFLIVFSQAGLSGWTAGTAFNRAWGVGFGDPEKPEREALVAFLWMGTRSFVAFALLVGVVVRILSGHGGRPGGEAGKDREFTSKI